MSRDVEALLGLAPLAVGDRVRVVHGGECPGYFGTCDLHAHPRHPHALLFDAQSGVVVHLVEHPSHPYQVQFPHFPHDGQRGAFWGRCELFARAELERR